MNYNIAIYALYIPLMTFMIVSVGLNCYHNGLPYIERALPTDPALALRFNNLLLVGYYLINIGYVLYTLAGWEAVENPTAALETLTLQVSQLLLMLGVLHYFNILFISRFLKRLINH